MNPIGFIIFITQEKIRLHINQNIINFILPKKLAERTGFISFCLS